MMATNCLEIPRGHSCREVSGRKTVLTKATMLTSVTTDSGRLLELAVERLRVLDVQAAETKLYGNVAVTMVYQNGKIERVRDVIEANHR